MGGFFVVIALAVAAAVGVIVLANRASGGTDVRTFWADLRAGLGRRRGTEGAPLEDEPEPVDVSFDRFFAEAPQADDGYLQLDDLAEALERTGERAAHLRERLPHARGGQDAEPEAPVRSDAVPAAAAPRPARRSGHTPGVVVVGPPVLPPQRGDG